ncbi:hypothetical protein PRZ48_011547 [Zasmidium cellare]|uniref:Mitochondrial transcription factor 1 n=1 Tax=Zasmidium cellare TaxID=395010 RepID=A0ABR0E6N5_ZASCE|nr:hypothetical protein PRZ48_011547 [Zasmidium cellare]
MSNAASKQIAALIDPKHPVISALGHTFGGYLPGKRLPIKGLRVKGSTAHHEKLIQRIDVVDEQLCDDVLKYLAPTLEPYKGCTIIDAQPGACIWSKKLNEFLKPKLHVLLESDERYAKRFIRPLLDQPGSTFKHIAYASATHSGVVGAFKAAVAEKPSLPPRPHSPDEGPRGSQLDTSVLVTGNLARTFAWIKDVPVQPARKAMLSLLQLTKWGALSQETFDSQGLVRMLWWLPDQHKPMFLPRQTMQLSSFNVGVNMSAHMTEVVGVAPADTYAQGNYTRKVAINVYERLPLYDAEIARLVRRKMDEAGMVIPEGRSVLGREHSPPETDAEMRSPVAITYHTVKKLETNIAKLETRLKTVLSALSEAAPRNWTSNSSKVILKHIDTVEYPQSFTLAQDYYRMFPIRTGPASKLEKQRKEGRTYINKLEMTAVQARIALMLDLELRIINLEAHYKALEEEGKDVAELKPRILKLGTDLHTHSIFNRAPIPHFFNDSAIPEQLAFFSKPPLLPVDRRPYEPFQTPLTSFWPRHPLALVDIVPTGRDLSVPGIANRYEATHTASELLKYLFTYKNQPVPVVLDKIAPNAAQDLIPLVSALTDPRKGGRLDPGMLKVRMLSEEMVEGLVRAWFEWPFKPRLIDLALAMDGSGGGEEGEADGEGEVVVAEE